MSQLSEELRRLRNRGETALASELEALAETSTTRSVPFSHRFLAFAAKKIAQGQIHVAHDAIGSSIEARKIETAGKVVEVSAAIESALDPAVSVPEKTFSLPLPDVLDSASFDDAPGELVSAFANLLVSAGYIQEAKQYLKSWNAKESEVKRKDLEQLNRKFKEQGAHAQAEEIEELGEELSAEDATLETEEEETAPMANEKPVLVTEKPSEEEKAAQQTAIQAAARGDVKAAKVALASARRFERMRLVAALIKAGDMELAMEGLEEEDGQGGYAAEDIPVEEPTIEEPALPEAQKECVETEETKVQPEPEPKEEEMKTEQVAAKLARDVIVAAKAKNIRKAVKALEALAALEKKCVASVRRAEVVAKDMNAAKSNYAVWAKVRKLHLRAQAHLALAEGDKEAAMDAKVAMERLESEEAMSAHDDMEGALDDAACAEELTDDVVIPSGGMPEDDELADLDLEIDLDDIDLEEGDEEIAEEPKADDADAGCGDPAEGMHYEVLQSLDEVKAMKVDRDSLAFTYWGDERGTDPYWVVQANGKPIAEIHLNDQDNAQEIRSYFCDENKYPHAIGQTAENAGLYDMLKGVHARFYANAIEKTELARKSRDQALASLKDTRVEKLADLRRDFVDCIRVSAESLNKGLISQKHNALKSAFVKTLASYGIHNPGLVVEDAFKEGFDTFIDQVMADAQEYLEMPKQAFDHAKRMVNQANNIAHATAQQFGDLSLSQRLGQNSMPFTNVPNSYEAPARESEVSASIREMSERDRTKSLRNRLQLSKR